MMKSCIDCGAEAADEALSCSECGRAFSYVAGGYAEADSEAVDGASRQRPDGGLLLTLGGVCLALAAALLLVALMQDNASPYGDRLEGAAREWLLSLVAGAVFQLGLVLTLAGAVIRAIWFLPGDETKPVPSEPRKRADAGPRPLRTVPGDDGAVV
jgi:hypothetical protein